MIVFSTLLQYMKRCSPVLCASACHRHRRTRTHARVTMPALAGQQRSRFSDSVLAVPGHRTVRPQRCAVPQLGTWCTTVLQLCCNMVHNCAAWCTTVLQHALHRWHRPFWDGYLDDLDCLCCISILLHVISSLFYNNESFIGRNAAEEGNMPRGLEAVLLAINLSTLGIFLSLFIKSLIENKFKRQVVKVLSTHVADLVLQVQRQVAPKGAGFLQLIETAKLAMPLLDENVRVFHETHGLGTIRSVQCENERAKPILVCFDSGAEHHYDMQQADRKLTVVFDPALNTPGFVHAKHFKRAVSQILATGVPHCAGTRFAPSACAPGPCADQVCLLPSPAGLEAIFLVLKAIDGTNGAAGDGPLISIAMVICAGTGLTPATSALGLGRALGGLR